MHPDDAEWDGWRPEQAAARLAGLDVPWHVAAGWAIDLFLGGERREHDDLEIGVPADRFDEVAAALAELDFHVVTRGVAEPFAKAGDLSETVHQTWGLDRAANLWRDRRLSRAPRRRRVGLPPRAVDSAPVRRGDRAHPRRDSVRTTGAGAALQGEARTSQGRGRPRRRATAPERRPQATARRVDLARPPRPLLAARPVWSSRPRRASGSCGAAPACSRRRRLRGSRGSP